MPSGDQSEQERAEATDTGRRWVIPPWLDYLAGWMWRLGVVALAVYVLVRLFWMLRLVTVPVLFALVFTALLWPLRDAFTRHRVPPALASAVVIALVGGLITALVWISSVTINDRLGNSEVWDETREEVQRWLTDGPLGLSVDQVERYEQQLSDAVRSGATSVGLDQARMFVEVVGSTILAVMLLFFLLMDGPRMWRFVRERIQPTRREAIDDAGRAAFRALGGYARGVAITGFFDAVAVGIVLLVLGVPLALPLSLLTFFGAFLPIVGATVVGALSTVVALVTVGPRAAIILAVATVVIQQLEGDLVLPFAMGSQVRLHPAVILVALAMGGALAGILGALVAVPITAMASGAVRAFRLANGVAAPEPSQT